VNQQNTSDTINWNGHQITFTWIPTSNIKKYLPVRQVHGLCLNDKGEVLICREPGEKSWKLPGGRPEKGETPIETLRRELMEEVNVSLKNVMTLGAQRVDFPHNPKKSEGDLFYQLRYLCDLKKLLPQKPDPDTGLSYFRKFVPLNKLNNYLKWGSIGQAIVKRSLEMKSKI
jgi:8-oxo-dGTP pyrophosphatase MutT (NUDIX family)